MTKVVLDGAEEMAVEGVSVGVVLGGLTAIVVEALVGTVRAV